MPPKKRSRVPPAQNRGRDQWNDTPARNTRSASETRVRRTPAEADSSTASAAFRTSSRRNPPSNANNPTNWGRRRSASVTNLEAPAAKRTRQKEGDISNIPEVVLQQVRETSTRRDAASNPADVADNNSDEAELSETDVSGTATKMSSADIIDRLAMEIFKGYPLNTCLNISLALDDLLEHRQENTKILYEVADELDKHTKKSSIAKIVGSTTGTFGKVVVVGVGAASVFGVSSTGFISAFAGGVLLTVGGAAAILGTATSFGTYVTEYMLCKKQLDKANQFITVDKMKVERYQKYFEELKVFFLQYDTGDKSSWSVKVVISIFNRFKEFIKDEKVDFKGIAKKLGVQDVNDLPNKMKQHIEVLYSNSKMLYDTTISLVGSNPMGCLAGGIVSVLFLDVYVLFKNTYNLATDKGHPTANELRNYARNLEKETQKLKLFHKCFNQQIQDMPEVESKANQRYFYRYDEETNQSNQRKHQHDDETESLLEFSSDEYESS